MQYRKKVEEELEDAPAPSFDQVNPEGFSGILGMDHHVAPPPPKKYTAEDRTSNDSGYRRPLLKRRYLEPRDRAVRNRSPRPLRWPLGHARYRRVNSAARARPRGAAVL